MKNTALAFLCLLFIACSKSNPPCSVQSFGLKHRKIDTTALRQNVYPTLEYYIPLSINGQTLELITDTGSSNFIVNNLSMAGLAPVGSGFPINYGSPPATTIQVQNYLGSVDFSCGQGLPSYYIGKVTQCTGSGCTPQILGLAYGAIARGDQNHTFWTDYVKANPTVSDEFSTLLCGVDHDAQSKIVFGGVDASVTGLQYTPILEKSWYVINATSLSIGGASMGSFPTPIFPCSSSQNPTCTILDSGTTISQIPTAMYQALKAKLISINNSLPAANDCFWPDSCTPQSQPSCSSVRVSGLPNLVIAFEGGLNLTIRPESYIKSTQSGQCAFGFAPGGDNFSILGQAVMENQYVHFDRTKNRIGFADAFQACGNS